jgi:hemerythrin
MDDKYLIGIEEIDAQHREIDEIARSIMEALELEGRWHHVHYIVVRLYESLKFHFAVEESVMRIVGFPDVEEHKLVHKEILRVIDSLKLSTLSSVKMSDLGATKNHFSFLPHIIDHDKKFAEFILANSTALRH